MVIAGSQIDVRPVGNDAFDAIYPLLCEFDAPRMHKADWHRMLFGYSWSHRVERGYALFADNCAVGFIGTIFSSRTINGRSEEFCNASSWIVRDAYRGASLLLIRPLLALSNCTILQLTPSPVAYKLFRKLGFAELESEQLLFSPIPCHPREFRALRGASFGHSRATLERELTGAARALYDELRDSSLTSHMLLRRGENRAYVVATLSHRKGVRFADVQHVSDLDFFWRNRLLAQTAFLRVMGAAAFAIDGRFTPPTLRARVSRRPAMRLYRPNRPEITPLLVDGLYSEWMSLRS